MCEKSLGILLRKLKSGDKITYNEWVALLSEGGDEVTAALRRAAVEVAVENFGRGIFVRGLIEISSYCRNNCLYCGLRCENRMAQRYRLSKDDILACCRYGASLGLNTFVLQGGEDSVQNDAWIADVVGAIRREHPAVAITLSVGERDADGYRAFKAAGADRYLLRHETRNDEHYACLHPKNMSGEARRNCLRILDLLGYQVGSGMMIGSPGQTTGHIAEDFMFLDEIGPAMIGVGPFIPASGTPFERHPHGSVSMTLRVISLLRLRFQRALIPATTALASLHDDGMLSGILSGANVVMPNLSPRDVRAKYSIYDNKKIAGTESAQQLQLLEDRLNSIGYHIDYGRGDYYAGQSVSVPCDCL